MGALAALVTVGVAAVAVGPGLPGLIERGGESPAPPSEPSGPAATGAARGLWPRNIDSDDGLPLSVGVADLPASVDLRGEPWPSIEAPKLRSVPVTVDLRVTGVLGVVGGADAVSGLVRWLLVQLATLRSPDDLKLVLITRIGELKELVAARTAAGRDAGDVRIGEEVVAVLDGALALRHLPGMEQVLRDGPSVGVYTICADRHDMNECRGLCELDGAGLRLTRRREENPTRARPEAVDREVAENLARRWRPARPADPGPE